MLLVAPVSPSDLPLALLNLELASRLDPACPCDLLISAPSGLDLSALEALARRWCPSVSTHRYDDWKGDPAWPRPQNWAWQSTARHIASLSPPPSCWLWWEADAVPLRPGWLTALATAYERSTKAFAGAVVAQPARTYMAGVALYPADAAHRCPTAMLSRRAPFDIVASLQDGLLRQCADLSALIHHEASAGRHFDSLADVRTLPPSAVLFHKCKDGSLPSLLLAGKPLLSRLLPAAPRPRAFYHSGDLGDITYALAAIKLAGGGDLLLGPTLLRTPPPANPLPLPQFERLLPLLEVQPYLKSARYAPEHPGGAALDLNGFRASWCDKGVRARTGIATLVAMHCYTAGVLDKFDPLSPWLAVPAPIPTGMFVVHRSPRYRPSPSAAFPWAMVLARFAGRLLFVGLPQEHVEFQKEFSVRTAFWHARDFLELARVIAGASGFIGNQSFPNALALALGQRVLQESYDRSPDCVLPRPNFLTQPFGEPELARWEGEAPPAAPKRHWWRSRPKAAAPAAIEITLQPRRLVSTTPVNGLIELGPQSDAHGLGDTLTITPLAARLGSRAVMCLPREIARFAPLFDGLCETRITEDYPVFPNPPRGVRFIEHKLRMFGFACSDGETPPVVRLRADELLPVQSGTAAWSIACAKEWAHVRTRPASWWKPISAALVKQLNLVEFDPAMPLREFAANLKSLGLYLGTNSGPWHLAVAMGCRCLVVDADACEGYDPDLWRYSLPTCEYVGFDTANVIAKLPWLLGGTL